MAGEPRTVGWIEAAHGPVADGRHVLDVHKHLDPGRIGAVAFHATAGALPRRADVRPRRAAAGLRVAVGQYCVDASLADETAFLRRLGEHARSRAASLLLRLAAVGTRQRGGRVGDSIA